VLRTIGCLTLLALMGFAAGCSSGQPSQYSGTVPSAGQFKPGTMGDKLKPPPPPPAPPKP
jgi:hypothetical protein